MMESLENLVDSGGSIVEKMIKLAGNHFVLQYVHAPSDASTFLMLWTER